jgi:lysophospholipase L1-like esterase
MSNINIFAVGDSHSIYYFDSNIVNHHWVGWGGMPVTMYQLVLHSLPLYNIVERLPPGDICHTNIKENDVVLFSYGWNDVQKNIYKYENESYKVAIDDLTNGYIKLIKQFTDGSYYKIQPIISCIFPIPQNTNSEMTGSKEDRINYTIYMNEKLKDLCCQSNIPFFDIYDLLHENNIISSKVVDNDKTHLDRKSVELRKIIEDKLKELINDNYGIKI